MLCLGGLRPAAAQAPVSIDLMAHAAAAYTRVDPVPLNRALGEFRLEQVNLTGIAGMWQHHLQLLGTVNLEGLTIPDGVLTLGGWGEGFNERRHPHTYMHELILSAIVGSIHGPRGSLWIGKGFAPFGTDDPMNRPPLRFPVNHHWSQILERAMVAGGAHAGPVMLEASLFNGDEPERPGQWPRIAGRFGDSWSARLTVLPIPGMQIQGSRAHVHSPEHRGGAGADQEKWSASGRWDRALGPGWIYALAEWARTEEAGGFFRFESWLMEASFRGARHLPYYRFERTERPEEERTLDPFRSLRPHIESTILGVSRWSVHTFGYSYLGSIGQLRVEPLLEIGVANVSEIGGGIFDVRGLFGRGTLWSLTVGLRARWGGPGHGMGRYGVAAPMHHQ